MKLLILGASGFIGRNFLEMAPKDIQIDAVYNSSKDFELFVKSRDLSHVSIHKCDLTKRSEVKGLVKTIGGSVDCCLFLAGNVNVPLSIEKPMEDWRATVGSVLNFLEEVRSVKRMVYLSTAGVYDGIKGSAFVDSPLAPSVPYCISKLAAEQYVRYFHSNGKIKEFTLLRFGGAFGPYSERKFMSSLVRNLAIDKKKEIEIYGDGTNIINVMYAKDAISALLLALRSPTSNTIANLGQENITIREAVRRSANALGVDARIKTTPKIKNQKYIGFEIETDFNSKFGFAPNYTFEEGVREFSKVMQNG